jgi:uncharacterized membrane protein YgcG
VAADSRAAAAAAAAAAAGRRVIRSLGAFLVACLCLIAVLPAAAQNQTWDRSERIVSFKSDVTVERDGIIRVHETITVNAQGSAIKRGIFRDFPTIYPEGVHVRFDVVRVTRNGAPEPYDIEGLDNGKRVRIGDADVFLQPGYHTYEIEYVTDRQLSFHARNDEFYWNVTGNAWPFRIDDAEVVVHLPVGARIIQSSFYTGSQGTKGQAARAVPIDDNTIRFVTTEVLGSNEGFTVAVGFSKGSVAEPTAEDRIQYFLRDHPTLAAFAIGLGILLVYFGVVWVLGGRDPKGGTIVPLFEPPDGLSPASVRYIRRMGYDGKMFSANLVSMAAKKFLTIKLDTNDDYTLRRAGTSAKEAGLTPDEAEIARELFAHGDNEIVLKQKNHTRVAKAIGALTKWLNLHFDGHVVRGNWSLFWPGLIIAFCVFVAIVWYSDNGIGAFLVTLWATISALGAFAFGLGCIAAWKDVIFPSGPKGGSLFLAIILIVPFAAFTAMTIGAMFFFGVPVYTAPLTWALIVVLVVFRRLLKAPTVEGARLLTAIKGFRLFLTTAEEDRLRALNPPDVTPELFERFLPYAIALDCETEWGRKFELAATRAGMSPAEVQSYQPTWYVSSGTTHDFSTAGFATAVGASLASATASASVSPSSTSYSSSSSSSSFNSGSSGGGSSGGGGGGGGGGGW